MLVVVFLGWSAGILMTAVVATVQYLFLKMQNLQEEHKSARSGYQIIQSMPVCYLGQNHFSLLLFDNVATSSLFSSLEPSTEIPLLSGTSGIPSVGGIRIPYFYGP